MVSVTQGRHHIKGLKKLSRSKIALLLYYRRDVLNALLSDTTAFDLTVNLRSLSVFEIVFTEEDAGPHSAGQK